MTGELSILLITTISLAFFHTISGPDHYLPFIMISKARKWNLRKTITFTAVCGLGHVGSSVLLGIIGIGFGIAVGKLELWEGMRGTIISWLLASFGLLYTVWGIRHSFKNKSHIHKHYHPESGIHEHEHNHYGDHTHIHANEGKRNITPWILFTIFVFGPCEPLIPIIMYPAAKFDFSLMVLLALIFSIITISTMIAAVVAANYGLKILHLKKIEMHYHALAGGTIFLCGIGMIFFGL
jgi:nickel/cobalt transporter (NicO) family protein